MLKSIEAANKRLKGIANITPVLTSRSLNKVLGAEIYFKCENFQRMGAFKFRGAYHCISQLTDDEKSRGVVAFSSGNHAQAVALVGRMLKINTTVLMPDNAPTTKLEAAKEYGATVVQYDPKVDSREEIAKEFVKNKGFTLIPPFNHLDIVAGQGTAVMEMLEETGNLDMLLVPCGGGGLLSGSAIAAKGLSPDCQVIGIEPELGDDATKSFYSKTLHSIKNPDTIADGVRTPSLGDITFPLILDYVDQMKTVSEQAIIEAVQFLFYRMKLVVEPSGALGLAALLSKAVIPKGRIGILISGGNIDANTIKKILNEKLEKAYNKAY
jgi:threo-3-hydroxy-L-aspartate ammonia-lyase